MKDTNMKTLVILLIFISYTYADIDGGTLTGLQILGESLSNDIKKNKLSSII